MLDRDTVFTQWENGNELRKFPFTETSSLVTTDGKVLSDRTISDLLLFYPESSSTPQLSCVKIGPGILSVAFCLGDSLLVSCIVSRKSFVPFQPYPMVEALPGSSGYISFGEIDWPDEPVLYRFDGTAQVDMRACIETPQPRVTSFKDDVSGEELSGIVTLALPDYVVPTITRDTATGVDHVRFDLTDYGRTLVSNSCHAGDDAEVCGVPVIKSICGVKPNSDGQILLRFV